ncbi:unnamed protein product [Leptidea sinapis]|uniref:Uncharacterized protein n=1 Tax=Leptidea sinapis TaxID=189913 RepID=A0A5E4QCK4_9NEOP|nr:unnamed protein product [Leptidea sinapis]
MKTHVYLAKPAANLLAKIIAVTMLTTRKFCRNLTIIRHKDDWIVGEPGVGERRSTAGMFTRCLQIYHSTYTPAGEKKPSF